MTWYILTIMKKSIVSITKMTIIQPNSDLSKFRKQRHHSQFLVYHHITFDIIWLDGFEDIIWHDAHLQLWKKVYFQLQKWLKISQIEFFQHLETQARFTVLGCRNVTVDERMGCCKTTSWPPWGLKICHLQYVSYGLDDLEKLPA